MLDRPLRGTEVRGAGLVLPPQTMPVAKGLRPLKRWRWLGVFFPELMLCAGDALVGPIRRRWWAIAGPGGMLAEGRGGVALTAQALSVRASGAEIELALGETSPVEIASPARRGFIWTAKRTPVPVRGHVELADGQRFDLDGPLGFLDESAGYHDRHTVWKWSAGIGTATDGRALAWNLVAGIHDGEPSERTLWVDGEPAELGPCAFAADLSGVEVAGGGALRFEEWARRGEDVRAGPLRSRYVQPFGAFSGILPGGIELASGHGVMEDHDARW